MLKKIMSVLTQVASNPSNNVQLVRGINYPSRTGNFKYYPHHARDMSLLTPPSVFERVMGFYYKSSATPSEIINVVMIDIISSLSIMFFLPHTIKHKLNITLTGSVASNCCS